jgi:post-segregation antitoxin (ccd killing protein)
MKNVTANIDDDLYEELQDLKINHHINISSFLVSAIKEKLKKEKPLEND